MLFHALIKDCGSNDVIMEVSAWSDDFVRACDTIMQWAREEIAYSQRTYGMYEGVEDIRLLSCCEIKTTERRAGWHFWSHGDDFDTIEYKDEEDDTECYFLVGMHEVEKFDEWCNGKDGDLCLNDKVVVWMGKDRLHWDWEKQ